MWTKVVFLDILSVYWAIERPLLPNNTIEWHKHNNCERKKERKRRWRGSGEIGREEERKRERERAREVMLEIEWEKTAEESEKNRATWNCCPRGRHTQSLWMTCNTGCSAHTLTKYQSLTLSYRKTILYKWILGGCWHFFSSTCPYHMIWPCPQLVSFSLNKHFLLFLFVRT